MLSSLSFQSCQEATAPENVETNDQISSLKKTSTIKLDDLDILAKQLALTLNKNDFREILRNDTKNAITREHILDAKNFFNKEVVLNNNLKSTFKDVMLSSVNSKNKKRLESIFNKLDIGQIDVYFPVVEHYKNWKANQNDLLVGFANPTDEYGDVTVYTLAGNKLTISGKEPPKQPCLMVNQCEHNGNHDIQPYRFGSNNNFYGSLKKTNGIASVNDEGGGGTTHHRINGKRETLHRIKFWDDGEAWPLGFAEPYAVCATAHNSIGELFHGLFPPRPYTDQCGSDCVFPVLMPMFRWYTSYGTYYKIQIAEQDGDNLDFSVKVDTGASWGVSIKIKNPDEALGSNIVNWNDPFDDWYNTGATKFWIQYEEN